MTILWVIFLALHIFFAGMALSQIPVGLFFRRALARAAGTPGELSILATQGEVIGNLGQYGGIGLLLTGLALLGVNRYGTTFGLLGLFAPTPTWLFIKQVVYILIVVILVVALTPASKRAIAALKGAAQSASSVTPEVREASAKVAQISLIIDLLVIVNVILAVWKPT